MQQNKENAEDKTRIALNPAVTHTSGSDSSARLLVKRANTSSGVFCVTALSSTLSIKQSSPQNQNDVYQNIKTRPIQRALEDQFQTHQHWFASRTSSLSGMKDVFAIRENYKTPGDVDAG